MNEKQLKSLFCKALASDHIKNNDILPSSHDSKIRIVEEANFRSFDLVIAAIYQSSIVDHIYSANYNNIFLRTNLLESYARREKCRIDCIRFYPVEVKSDNDAIDQRLPNQIINAILTFGLSILVLDKKHGSKIKASNFNFIPSTVVRYTGTEDYFEVVSTFDRFISSGIFSFNKSTLAKALAGKKTNGKVYNRLALVQRILQKLAFNQLYYENLGLTEEELEFMQTIAELRLPSKCDRKKVLDLVKETANAKLTDFL